MKVRQYPLMIGIIVLIIPFTLFFFLFFHKKHFVHNRARTEFLTIWMRQENECYIIPGKHIKRTLPDCNFIKTVNHRNYIGIIWNTEDRFDTKISIYNDFEEIGISEGIKTYSLHDSLLYEYRIIESLSLDRDGRVVSEYSDSLRYRFDCVYVDLNRIFGIKVNKIRRKPV